MGFLSPDGICHSFDTRANGYARAEGFGVVIIKTLSSAVMNGDTIRAVVRATGVNQDGGSLLAMPNRKSQSQLIIDTYRDAGLDLSSTRYVEAHGWFPAPVSSMISLLIIYRPWDSSRRSYRDKRHRSCFWCWTEQEWS